MELKAYKKEKVPTQKGTKYRNVEILKELKQISSQDTILAGSERSVGFQINIPSLADIQEEVSTAVEAYEATHKGIHKYYKARNIAPKVYWKIQVHVYASGFDLYRQESLLIKTQKN